MCFTSLWSNNDKRNKSEYLANTDADKVLHYVANPNGKYSLVKPDDKTNPYQYYPANTLTKEVSIDADEKRVETFKDLLGNVILQRTVLDDKHNLDTYYVYDAVGQLCYVLPPLYQKNGKKAITAYEYRYDSKGRIIKKFLPGAEYIQYWYDNADRIVAMQDGVMRKDNIFRFMIYDNLGRLVIQGRCSNYVHNQSYCDKNAVIATFNSGNNGFLGTSYVVPSQFLTAVNNSALLEIANYYDKNQDNIKGDISKYFSDIKITTSVSQNGQQTGSVVAASNGDFTAQVMVYDLKGNLTNTCTREIGGRITSNASTYTYTNKLSFSETYVSMPVGGSLVIGESYNFNNKIDKKSSYTLSLKHGDKFTNSISYAYNELGQLKTITRPLPTSMSRTVTYAYDIRGWLKSITTNSFKEDLFYADCPDKAYNCYNGNIGTMRWSNSNYEQIRGYKFVYDNANRLTDALYGERAKLDNKVNRYNEVLEYDENGNITSLQRRGLKQDGQYGKIDNLNLSYNGNQLFSVEEDAKDYDYAGSFEFKKLNGSGYKYNENGSLVADKSRGIAYITYDLNNNPDSIFFTSGSMTRYVYSASGQKLRVVHYTAKRNMGKTWGIKPKFSIAQIQDSVVTDYLLGGRLVMKYNNTLKRFVIDKYLFDGGYAQATSASSTTDKFAFNYYNQDHLGNNREVVNASGVVQQVTNYYPFGAPYADATAVKGANLQPYKYNGKELDLMHGLNTYDYGARQHDPILARWDRMDPLCEKYYNVSPYNYCHNNPVMMVDPDGKDDYYDENGHYIGRRDTGTDYIYIATSYTTPGEKPNTADVYTKIPLTEANISAEAWSNLLTKIAKDAGVDFSKVENSSISTVLVSKETKDDQFQTPYIDDEYGMPNYGVKDCYGGKNAAKTGGEKAKGEKASITAFIWPVGSDMRDYYATVSNIQHLLYTHEYNGHYILGLDDSYNFDQKLTESPLWHKTTEAYKQHVRNRMANGIY